MSKQIKIFDTTLRDGEQSPGCSMNLSEKLEVARVLDKLNVDVIEAGFAIASPGDFESVSAVAGLIKNSKVASLSRATQKDIEAAYNALKGAVSPRIHTFLATSPIHMQYKLKMTPDEVVEKAAAMVKYAKSLCADVEFSAEDACRSDKDFLVRIFNEVIKAGATVINVPDTVGYITAEEMTEYIRYITNHVTGIEKVDISVHCHNDLGMAVANSLAAIKAGASQVECTINGIGERAGNASLEEVVMSLKTREQYFDAVTNIDTKQIYKASRLITSITGVSVAPTKPIVGQNAFAHEAGIHQHGVLAERTTYEIMTPESIGIPQNKMVLGKHSGRHAFEDRLNELGFTLEKEMLDKTFEQFKILADKKKVVLDADLEALVENKALSLEEKYTFERFVINSGNTITATAIVSLGCEGKSIEKVAIGDGPVDAAFKAINKIVGGSEIALDDYAIHSVTSGEDAQGEAIVKLSRNGLSVTGRGLSTDVMEASIRAYINGVNKLLLSNK